MNDPSKTFNQENSQDTPKSTSSPASEDGPTPSGSPAGQTTNPSGPAAVRVSRFRALDADKDMPIDDICGPLFTTLLPSASLQRSLGNRLRARMDVSGTPEYVLTWRESDMPAGVQICRLEAWERPINVNGFSSWPTPTAGDGFAVLWCRTSTARRARGEQRTSGAKIGKLLKYDTRVEAHLVNGCPNPNLSRKLMGFPVQWTSCAPTATRSSRK